MARKPQAKRKPGRPTKLLDDQVREKLISAIRAGNYIETAVAYAGITSATWRNWVTWATEGKQPYAELFAVCEKARADAEVTYAAIVAKAAQGPHEGTWQAAAWWLERSFPERWGRKERLDVTSEDGLRIVLEGK